MVRHSRNSRVRTGRKGFTLLELLLVMAILVVLAGLGTAAYGRLGAAQSVKAAKFEIKSIEKICQMYQLQVGRFPQSLNDLVVLPSGLSQSEWNGPYYDNAKVPKDPWKNDFAYSVNEAQGRVFVTSNGPDGAKGTADDIPGKDAR
jgi:general secretion pathway protein G